MGGGVRTARPEGEVEVRLDTAFDLLLNGHDVDVVR